LSDSKALRKKLYATIFWQCSALPHPLDEGGRRDAMEAIVGKRSMRKCTTKELYKVIEDFAERGVRPSPSTGKGRPRKSTRRPVNGAPGSVARMITPNQRRTIEKIAHWYNFSAAYIRGISRRQSGRDFPQTTREATALILALSKTKRKEPSYDSLPSSP